MNERGNITVALLVVLMVLGVVVAVAGTLLKVKDVTDRAVESTVEMYGEDTAIELMRYVVINEISNIEYGTFDGETELLTDESVRLMEGIINKKLTKTGKIKEVGLELIENKYISTACSHLYSEGEDGETIYLGIHCEYIPLGIKVGFTYKDAGETGDELKVELLVQGIYLYEDSGTVKVDSTQIENHIK